MKFWTDGSRVGGPNQDNVIGWSAVCESCVVVAKAKKGGSNINAEIFAIRDLLLNLSAYRRKMVSQIAEGDKRIDIVTDSKTSIQIIHGYQRAPHEFDVNESENYRAAQAIVESIDSFMENFGIEVAFEHIRGHQGNLGNVFADYVATSESGRLLESIQEGRV